MPPIATHAQAPSPDPATAGSIEAEVGQRPNGGPLCIIIYGFANYPYRYGHYKDLAALQAAAAQHGVQLTNLDRYQDQPSAISH